MEYCSQYCPHLRATKDGSLIKAVACERGDIKPCNNCGWCCHIALCEFAEKRVVKHRRGMPCPFLVKEDSGKYLCMPYVAGLISAKKLGIGGGCTNQWDDSVAKDRRKWLKERKKNAK